MIKRIEAILWRRCNQVTLDALRGVTRGQYDIRLTKIDYSKFFDGYAVTSPTPSGGFTVTIPIAPYDGPNPVGATELKVRFMGPKSERADWYIPSQRPETAYELWRPGRGPTASGAPGANEYVVLARDVDKNVHARWINDTVFNTLPVNLKEAMQSADAGWKLL